ncbi:hypothetical protein FA15DRAFT_343874 [Coprinopsis marcescibilis]|uniref:Uncharacterized protein n=1 Tax=Coprinopsis marcescibilis TaxID=230819 RepID=A0A5C3LAM3_COPMA|nr:hypothetical protein FA15DRAFT_343874 [Coprinopsis marcescibilis]
MPTLGHRSASSLTLNNTSPRLPASAPATTTAFPLSSLHISATSVTPAGPTFLESTATASLPTEPQTAPTIHAAATARIYHTNLPTGASSSSSPAKRRTSGSSSHGDGGDNWTYSRLRGTVAFGRSWATANANTRMSMAPDATLTNSDYFFTLSDATTGKTIWMFQIPSPASSSMPFVYEQDRPFFHIFNGRVSTSPLLSLPASFN